MVDIAPKKADWDLKREIEKKLERLEIKTQRAIVDIVREKLQQRQKLQQTDDLSSKITIEQAKMEESDEDEQ